MIRVAIAGVAGRMGQALVQAVDAQKPELQITAASVLAGDSVLAQDIGISALGQPAGVMAVADLETVIDDFDVLIDFTSPASSLVHLELCRHHGKSMVLGTTGFSASEKDRIAQTQLPLVFAPNMSVGVTLCLDLLARAARVLGDEVDIEITEAHHRFKKDAPSGTALQMGEVVAGLWGASWTRWRSMVVRASVIPVTRKPSASIPFGQVTLSAITPCSLPLTVSALKLPIKPRAG